ncbi:coproporphyrinogen III oxidase [Bacillus sp. HMF5848]|uniref:coproporphyrinogen III oxidase n=1 Tax=Bacillus sp. HMF5848 TaxID=2495421 RepID=UPI000F788F41|nr:coproporphyrinogen III oxidase [Bacillus sp. HMF5848]RSK26308.1 coproporphyrinogen III oxidase [Bacillus sp. HMF5848]
MKNIKITGITEERLIRPFQLIADLFFENSTVSYELTDEDFIVDFKMELNDTQCCVQGTLLDVLINTKYKTEYSEQRNCELSEKALKKLTKRVLIRVFLQLFEQATSIKQNWGVLTGIRPTKLVHKRKRQGHSTEDIRQELKEIYGIRDKKITLMEQIVDRQLQVIPDLYNLDNEVSIYIGIPYCPTKCAYCTFPAYAIQGRQGAVDSFLAGLHYEIQEIGAFLKKHNKKITTIYFGGGTPTSISAEEMDTLYEIMYESFPHMESVREVTVEAGRPDTITVDKLNVLKKYNIDRISINPQSYIQETLKAIGRHHTVEETVDKFTLARQMEMNNINMDLIIGLPGEGLTEFDYSLAETAKLMPESLTVHTLSFKRASEMTKNKDKYKVADRDEITQMMERAEKWTEQHGYLPYYLYRQKNILGNLENVGYSLPGKESLYNILIIEEMQTIIGLGCGASSKFIDSTTGKIIRQANPKEPKAYNLGFVSYTEEKIKILETLFS